MSAMIKSSWATEVFHGCFTCSKRVGFHIRSWDEVLLIIKVQHCWMRSKWSKKSSWRSSGPLSSHSNAATEPLMLCTLDIPCSSNRTQGNHIHARGAGSKVTFPLNWNNGMRIELQCVWLQYDVSFSCHPYHCYLMLTSHPYFNTAYHLVYSPFSAAIWYPSGCVTLNGCIVFYSTSEI